MATVRCPSCERALEVEEAYRDWTVRCPHCGGEFVPDAVGTEGRRPRPRPRREEPDDRYDRRDDEDDRAEDDRAEEDRDANRAEALRVVAAPAMWLEIIGWLSALFALGIGGLCIAIAAEQNNNPNANNNANDPDEMFWVFAGCCTGVLGVPYSVAMAIGARHMRTLNNRGWAMAGAILGIASFSLFGICGIVQAGFGAWALVTLDHPAVRAAFGLEPRRPARRRRRRDWDE